MSRLRNALMTAAMAVVPLLVGGGAQASTGGPTEGLIFGGKLAAPASR